MFLFEHLLGIHSHLLYSEYYHQFQLKLSYPILSIPCKPISYFRTSDIVFPFF